MSIPKTADIVIIGGGVMGASTAYHLALRGQKNIVLLEKDEFFGQEATGKCAGGVRFQFSTEINVRLSLASLPMLDRFKEARIVAFGPSAGLALTRPPLTRLQLAEKRAFDLVVASLSLVLLAPFFLLVALAIRLESPGPALFRQTRYGFNQEPFRIFKFRTMRTLEDGATVRAATRNDPRVTRLGALLRRTSVDELPQLLNVISGEMSIVGPRPQAMAHDQLYVERIARYARRHNVKPGITGWAQVNGLRGEIRTNEDIQARVEHDLYYVDHWSLWLDLKIVLATAFGLFGDNKAY